MIDKGKDRIDCILIWGHGIQFFEKIRNDIQNEPNLKILKIQKYRPKSIRRLVREIYSHDYAPYSHLKDKTKYLLKTQKEVCFIFVKNLKPEEDLIDEGRFRHNESISLKKFKEMLRDKYNPRKNGIRTHDHVIHATDSEKQTEQLLQYLGYKEGIRLFQDKKKTIEMPYYMTGYTSFEIKKVKTNSLYCNIIEGSSWDDCRPKMVSIKDSPHYAGLNKDIKIYYDYITRFAGGPLQEDYNIDRFLSLSKKFNYLEKPYNTSFVIVEESDNKLIIHDGLHRAAIHIHQGHEEIIICRIAR
jgi:hypothetical protein